MYKENFPQRIKEARAEAGYTQREVAEMTGIPNSTIAKYETGRLEPNLEYLGTLAQFYNKSINWLLGVSIEKFEPEIPKPSRKKINNTSLEV